MRKSKRHVIGDRDMTTYLSSRRLRKTELVALVDILEEVQLQVPRPQSSCSSGSHGTSETRDMASSVSFVSGQSPRHVPWALLAGSATGSTWVNHVLSSDPCCVSVGEYLMANKTAAKLFASAGKQAIARVLLDVVARNKEELRRREEASGRRCTSTAGGVKLKLAERDITFGTDGVGNAAAVADALHTLGFQVILLQRSNHLDNVLGRLSRRKTGVLHCLANGSDVGVAGRKARAARSCTPEKLNTSLTISCAAAKRTIDRLRLRKRASELLFTRDRWPRGDAANDGSGRVLRLEYEALVERPQQWLSALRLLRLPAQSACLLQHEHRKRVVQTQRELITNWHAFAPCMRRAGHVYAQLLQPDKRPASGVLPIDNPTLCPPARAGKLRPLSL